MHRTLTERNSESSPPLEALGLRDISVLARGDCRACSPRLYAWDLTMGFSTPYTWIPAAAITKERA